MSNCAPCVLALEELREDLKVVEEGAREIQTGVLREMGVRKDNVSQQRYAFLEETIHSVYIGQRANRGPLGILGELDEVRRTCGLHPEFEALDILQEGEGLVARMRDKQYDEGLEHVFKIRELLLEAFHKGWERQDRERGGR